MPCTGKVVGPCYGGVADGRGDAQNSRKCGPGSWCIHGSQCFWLLLVGSCALVLLPKIKEMAFIFLLAGFLSGCV